MSVNGIHGYSQMNAYKAYSQAASSQAHSAKVLEEDSAAKKGGFENEAATVELSSEGAKASETSVKKKGLNEDQIRELQSQVEEATKQLMNYVHESLMGRADKASNADESVWRFLAKGNFTVSAAAKEEAQKAISEGGFFSVDKTADRLVDFAKSLAGDDPAMAEKMRSAVQKGFKEAEKVWGGKLPDISAKTYDATMKRFDDWANEGKNADQVAPTI